jgi:exonuclease SbcC
MAAELAGALDDGTPCQVCGSVDHPRLATPGDDAVTDADQLAAETVLAERVAELEATEAVLSRQQSRADSLAATAAGLTTAGATAVVDELSAALDDAAAARRRQAVVEAEIVGLRELEAALGHRRSAAAERLAGLRQSVASRERLVAEVSAELADALGGDGGRPVHAVLDDLTTVLGLVVEVQRAADDLAGATERADTAAGHADEAAAEHGFAGPADVAAARLGVRERDRLVAELAARTDVEARAQAVLDDPAFDTLDDEPPVDPAPLALAVGAAEATAAHAARDLALLEDRARALRTQRGRLVAALEEWAPLRDASLRVESMSRLVRGMGSDNQLQMRLSAYVLATRLDQVVAAANERLGHLRDQRYLLQRTGRAERRGSQAGLGLEVVDQWTGDVRSPATLSGGETFVVSLSLALGLADVVTQEAGGTEVETLFVDEGFGTLDADTLDDVMDRLDGLRAGGRTVGVVSHVTELRSRIPTQVHVEKTRTGSVVTVRTLVG